MENCASRLSSGSQLGRVPFQQFFFATGQVALTQVIRLGSRLRKLPKDLPHCFSNTATHFIYLFRRGQGLSTDQGPFMQDILQREETAKGKEARQHLQFVLATTDHLDDVMGGLSFLKATPAIDARRLAIVGHSFGGQLTLLAAERDNTLRAAVTSPLLLVPGSARPNCANGCSLQLIRQPRRSCWFRRRTITARHQATHWPVNWNVCTNLIC